MSSDQQPSRAPKSLILETMDHQIRDQGITECAVEDGTQDEGSFGEAIQRDGTPGGTILEGVIPETIVPEEVIDLGTPTELYQYAPLSRPDEIRCLVLESGTGDADDPLVCSLHHHSLDDEPDFEAISYTWGSSNKTHTIFCNGRRLAITKNLHTCLLQTRLPDSKRTLWADSICINQDNLREKGHQVSMMSRIYSESRKALICLGPDENGHAKDVADLVSEVARWLQTILMGLTDGQRDSFPYTNQNEWPNSDRRWVMLSSMTGLSWFKRGWVIQEAALAKDAQIIWGDVEIGWIDVLRALMWAGKTALDIRRPPGTVALPSFLHTYAYITKYPTEALVLNARRSFTLLESLNLGRNLLFGDKRDHIYAFLGLSAAMDARHGLEVRYELSYLQVYFEFANWYINRTQDIELLRFVDHDNVSLLADIPSWVPQWHIRRREVEMTPLTSEPILSVSKRPNDTALAAVQGTVLKVHGLLLDHIVWTSQVLYHDASIEEIAGLWAKFEEHIDQSAYRKFPPGMAFLQAIELCMWDRAVELYMSTANFAEYILRLRNGKPLPSHPSFDVLRGYSKDYHGDVTLTHRLVQNCVARRRLAMTARGYCGVVPPVVQEGDVCCIIFGTKSPYIIRPTGHEGHNKILGEASLASTHKLEERLSFPHRVGSGPYSHEDWLEWNLEEQEILLC